MKYKMIIFDADDTLFDFQKAEAYAFEKALNEMGLAYKEEYLKVYIELNKKIWKEMEDGKITQEELKQERFRRFLDQVNLEGDTLKFSNSFLRNLSEAGFLFDDSLDLVKQLSKSYRLVMITNGLTRVQKYRVREHPIAKYFEKVIISEEIGYKKPDSNIFEKGLSGLLPVNKSEILMVGDSLTSDIQGGINYGIDTCWFNLSNKENDTLIKPTYLIKKLKELLDIL